MAEEIRYDAFISYRHCLPDKEIAEKLHKELENYRMPYSIAKKLGKRKLERVFRDEAELAVSAELSAEIEKALLHSEYLIVICTPRLQESEWCMREIELFLKISDRDHILLVLADGEPSDSFPEILTYEDILKKNASGKEVWIREEREPLAGDCRGKNASERKKAMKNTVLRLIAVMFGIRFDDLKRRQKESQARRSGILTALIFLVVFCVAAQNTYFLIEQHKQNLEIQDKLASITAISSGELLSQGRRQDAIYAAQSVLPSDPGKGYNTNAFIALQNALSIYSTPGVYIPEKMIPLLSSYSQFDKNGTIVLSEDMDGYREIVDIDTQEVIYSYVSEESETCEFCGKKGLYCKRSDGFYYIDFAMDSERKLDIPNRDDLYETFYYFPSHDENTVIVKYGQDLYALQEDKVLYRFNISIFDATEEDFCFSDIQYSADDKYVLALILGNPGTNYTGGKFIVFDSKTGEIISTYEERKSDVGFALLADNGFVYSVIEKKGDTNISRFKVFNIEKNKLTKEWSPQNELYSMGKILGDKIVFYNDQKILVLDSSFQTIASSVFPDMVNDVVLFDGKIAYLTWDGEFRVLRDDFPSFEETPYVDCDFSGVNSVIFKDGSFIYSQYDRGYIIEYKRNETKCFLPVEEIYVEDRTGGDYDKLDEFANEIAGKEDRQIINYLYSGDGRYCFLQTNEHELLIYDSKTKKQLARSYEFDGTIFSVEYSEKYNCFLIVYTYRATEDRIAVCDSSFTHIADVRKANLLGIEEGTKEVLIMSEIDNKCYRLSFLSYEEVMNEAREELQYYEPDPMICEKYGLKYTPVQ